MSVHSKRFQAVCEKLKENAARFIDNPLLSESSDEDEINESELMKNTFSSYDEVENVKSAKTREILQDVLTSGAIVCLICIESIKRHDKIWSCQNCYCMLHLDCIQKWAKDSTHHLASNVNEDKKKDIKWCCPKCRKEYVPTGKLLKYLCFCGKVENPPHNEWSIPHSCGETCNKRLQPDCSHTCCLLCHPGPCPPCPKTVLVSCCCSKSEKISRRCSDKEWLCRKVCHKLLHCKIHYCNSLCHTGDCPPCQKQSEQSCQCKRNIMLRSCYDTGWQCKEICDKPLGCGNHKCKVVCHAGTCPDCPNSGPRLCPCGKISVILPCTEAVPPCGDTCNKLLDCDLHRCNQRCHYGSCEKCLQMRVVKCRCGQKEKSVLCGKEFICEIKCKKRRDCGRHNCNKKCCTENCPPCELPCERSLNCGRHKCTSICHAGPCYPCKEMAEVACSCGSTKFQVPCGRKKFAAPPRCSSDCKLSADCHHKERHKHKCHFGSCPPCHLVCGKTLKCGHPCSSRCHSAVLTKIETKTKKEGPWDLVNSSKMGLVCKPCPPCSVLLPVTCLGGHETQEIPCHQSQPTSCGRMCGRILPCGNHNCSLQCHIVNDITDLVKSSDKCETCDEPCQKPRKKGCLHSCPLPCHAGECPPCKQHIKSKCHCQINTMYIVCEEWSLADETKEAELLSCSNRCPKEMDCGHRCILSCHLGSCSTKESCKKKVTLRCPCKKQKKVIRCHLLKKRYLLCDAECYEHEEKLRAIELQKVIQEETEEKEREEIEYNKYLKKMELKKKKKSKQIDHNERRGCSITFIIMATAVFICFLAFLINTIYGSYQ